MDTVVRAALHLHEIGAEGRAVHLGMSVGVSCAAVVADRNMVKSGGELNLVTLLPCLGNTERYL